MKVQRSFIFTRSLIPLITLLYAIYFIARGLTNPEAHHDGLIFANAVASKDGLFPNRDFFAQYGPLSPTLNGWLLSLFGSHLYILRISNAVILALIAGFILYSISKYFNIRNAILISLIWVLSSGLNWIALLPWPSVLLQLAILSSITLLIKNYREEIRKAKIAFFSSGFILTTCILIRVQAFIFIIFLAILIFSERKKLQKNIFQSFAAGTLLAFCSLTFWLFLNDSLYAYYRECIVWANSKYGSPNFPLLSLIPIAYFPAITLAWMLWFQYVKRYLNYTGMKNFIAVGAPPLIFLSVCFGISLTSSQTYISFHHPDIFIRDIFRNFLFSPHYVVTTFSVSLFIFNFFRLAMTKTKIIPMQLEEKLSFFLVGTALMQLYPAWDSGHIWWVMPEMILGITLFCANSRRKHFHTFDRLYPTFIAFALILGAQNIAVMSEPRTPYQNEILKFMTGPQVSVQNFKTNIDALNSIPISSSLYFDCTDAIFSVSNGTYSPKNLNMVNWSPRGLDDSRFAEYIFACNKKASDLQFLIGQGFRVIDMYPTINLPNKHNFLLKRTKLNE